ncbi:glycoside hydrolase family 30 protein [Pseudoxanthomonas putridarboris]|uniref:Glycoside hydrolase family 30 protein n=1 Tax=Pseudoxanthomonas putridarboris TaxID=752605 RepID=A0ABU9IVK7_9GAMM
MKHRSLFATATLGALLAGIAPAHGQQGTREASTDPGRSVSIFTTAQGTNQRLSDSGQVLLQPGHPLTEAENSIFVNPGKRFQPLLGIGGSITDASAEVFAKLAPAEQEELLKAYYDPRDGIGYTLLRTTIHSSDFSSASYTYIEEGDKALSTFSIDHDRKLRIPLIKRAIEAAGGSLTTYASPWSAPAFMKTNRHMLRGGSLLPEYADAWARYYAKFIQDYEAEGIPIWGITVQNEPMATQTWESMLYTAEEERDFLKNHLGPTMHRAGYADRKIIVWDHNRDMMVHRARVIFDDPEASRYAWGMGFHWYETWAGGEPMFGNVAAVAQAYPDKHLLLTEATVEKFDPARYQHWPNAERYGTAIINDLNNGAEGWTDWNILLDQQGGPNHVGNFCFSPIHGDTTTGELIYTPSYYYIGHFSKFIRPDARRVSAVSSRSNLLTTAFVNPDNRLATVVMNPTDQDITYNFYVGDQSARVTIPARAIQTLLH